MRDSGLDWKDRVFNVDSFQGECHSLSAALELSAHMPSGNERDYVIVSLVRTQQLGFLKDLRRTNVMLTRCKRGMYIVTDWDFVFKKATDTLVGRMAAAWDVDVWINPEHLFIEEA